MKKIVSNGLGICAAIFAVFQVGHTKKAETAVTVSSAGVPSAETTAHGCGCSCSGCMSPMQQNKDV